MVHWSLSDFDPILNQLAAEANLDSNSDGLIAPSGGAASGNEIMGVKEGQTSSLNFDNGLVLRSDTPQVPTKETACKTVNDQPTVKAKKFQKETFQNVSRTVGINAQKSEKKKSVKVS